MHKDQNEIITSVYSCAAGDLLTGVYEGRLCLCDWVKSAHHTKVLTRVSRYLNATIVEGSSDSLLLCHEALDAYFSGYKIPGNLNLQLCGTPFQQAVWKAISEIGYGETVSYGELAASMGCPAAIRAVASAVGANALSVFVPCHRVVSKSGAVRYAGGAAAKSYLLNLELSGEERRF